MTQHIVRFWPKIFRQKNILTVRRGRGIDLQGEGQILLKNRAIIKILAREARRVIKIVEKRRNIKYLTFPNWCCQNFNHW
jgi:hypothetical protein